MRAAITITLGDHSWTVEPLPFGLLKKLQPRYLAMVARATGPRNDDDLGFVASEKDIAEMGEIVRTFVASSAPEMTLDAFDGLRFTTPELVAQFRRVGDALGLMEASAGEPAATTETPSLSTT